MFEKLPSRNDNNGVNGKIRSFKTMLIKIRFILTSIAVMFSFFFLDKKFILQSCIRPHELQTLKGIHKILRKFFSLLYLFRNE